MALRALAESRGVSRSRCVRQLIDEAATGEPAKPRRELSEAELLDLLRERGSDANVFAISRLLDKAKYRSLSQPPISAATTINMAKIARCTGASVGRLGAWNGGRLRAAPLAARAHHESATRFIPLSLSAAAADGAEWARGNTPHHARLILARHKKPQPGRSAGLVASCGCGHEPS